MDNEYQRVPRSTSVYHSVSRTLQLESLFVPLTWTFPLSSAERSNPATSKSGSAANVQAGTLLEVCRHLVGHSWTHRDTESVSRSGVPILASVPLR